MLSKIRPNVIFLAVLIAAVTGYLAVRLLDKTEAILSGEILSLLVGIGIGGLVTAMGTVAQDPPPPTVPASTFEKMVDRIAACEREGKSLS